MKPEEINQRIAIACGWSNIEYRDTDCGQYSFLTLSGIKDNSRRPLPKYSECLNAIHEAVMMPKFNTHHREYAQHLREIVNGDAEPDPHEDDFYLANATASQRCKALLGVLGLLEDRS